MSYSAISFFLENQIEIDINNSIDDSDFNCIQPSFINGVYEGSKFVYINAEYLPDGLRIYMNTGEFGFVKDEKCFIRLETPMVANSDVFCYILTEKCNVESCTYTVGSLISGSFVCSNEANSPIPNTLTGAFVCDIDHNLRSEIFNEYGNSEMGDITFEDCIWCGGTLPNCEEVP